MERMAVYQFQFALLPAVGITRLHTGDVDYIGEYAARDPDAEINLDEESPNYWAGIDKIPLQKIIGDLLPGRESWSDEAFMYGDSKRDHIEIWDDTVYVSLDARNLNVPLLRAIVAAAHDHNCKLVLKDGGKVIFPHLADVLAALDNSSAMKFLRDPAGFLEGAR